MLSLRVFVRALLAKEQVANPGKEAVEPGIHPTNKGAEGKGCFIRSCQQLLVGKIMTAILKVKVL